MNNLIEIGSGSGFIIDSSKGYIVTNYHVIKGAQKLLVHLADGKNIYAEVVGADSRTWRFYQTSGRRTCGSYWKS